MKKLLIILIAFVLYSCNSKELVNIPEGDEKTQYIESLIANASTNIDFDEVIEQLTTEAIVIERHFWRADDIWKEEEPSAWVGIVFEDDICYSYLYEPIFGSYVGLHLRCDKYEYRFDKRGGELYIISENYRDNRTQEARVVDYKDNSIFLVGELPFPSSYGTSFYIGSFDADIQAKWDAVIAEQEKESN